MKFGGPYRLVRHPMYLGYFVNQIGLLLSCFSLMNTLIYAATWVCQVRRVHEEERQLWKDPAYRDFASRISSRLIPRLY